MNTNQIKRCKPKYTLEFKQDTARLVLEKGLYPSTNGG